MIKKIVILICLVVLTASCSIYKISSEDTTTNYYPSKMSLSEVAYIESAITKPHEIIGYVTVSTERSQSFEEILQKLKYEAAILGADAVTDIKTDATGTWKKLPAQKLIGNAYVRANFTATAVVFK